MDLSLLVINRPCRTWFPTRVVQVVWQWLERTVTSQFTFFGHDLAADTVWVRQTKFPAIQIGEKVKSPVTTSRLALRPKEES